jgi:molybdate/tungstate transport system substrate-binding protein
MEASMKGKMRGSMSLQTKRSSLIAGAIFLFLAIPLVAGCAPQKETLTIYHAGSLAVPFSELKAEFEATHPDVEVLCESGGSAAMINKAITVSEAGEAPPNIIASADYKLIPDRLYEGGYADWNIAFARNTMVLCYRDGAPGSEAVMNGSRTWYDVLRNDLVSYGHSNPDDDPCGYRTLLVAQLAQRYYHDNATEFGLSPDPDVDGLYDALIPGSEHDRGRVGGSKEVVRSKSVDLIASIQSGDLDYAFEYRSVAVQHGLNFIGLDDAINLGSLGMIGDTNITYEDFYQEASVQIMKEPGPPPTYETEKGEPIVYGITILKNAENKDLAVEFVAFLLSEQGQDVMESNGQPFIEPLLCDYPGNLPAELKEVL